MRTIAIDWSGAKSARGKIWIAVCDGGRLQELAPAHTREHAIVRLLDHLATDPRTVCGVDFAFSMPAWFLGVLGARTAPDLWTLVEERGERWLERCPFPFWGRPGTRRPHLAAHFRRTEERVAEQDGAFPKSVFQIGGAGSVGTGSIRGMPFLSRIRAAGVSVWPFDAPTYPMVVEMYPRLLTGRVVKSAFSARVAYLDRHCPGLDPVHRTAASSSEDAFDAAVSALRLEHYAAEPSFPPTDRVSLVEGRIWPERVANDGTPNRRSASRRREVRHGEHE